VLPGVGVAWCVCHQKTTKMVSVFRSVLPLRLPRVLVIFAIRLTILQNQQCSLNRQLIIYFFGKRPGPSQLTSLGAL
jgi:hypothetical protein